MATRAELAAALKAADAAGDDAAARKLAAALTNYSDENDIPSPPPEAPPPVDPSTIAETNADSPMWQRMLQPVSDAGRIIGNGATLGGWDALVGKLAPAIGGSDTAGQRALTEGARARGGVGGAVLGLGSSMLPALATDGATAAPALGTGVKGALAKLGVGAAEGAGYGGIQANFEGRDPLLGMGGGVIAGAGGQAAAGILSKAGSKIAGLFTKKPARMSIPALEAAKNQAYDAVNKAGVEYTPGTIRGMLADMDAASPAYPGRHDQVIAAKNQIGANIGNPARPVTLPEIDLNRQIIGRDLNSLPDRAQQEMGLDMTNAMDDHLRQVTPIGVTARSGDPADGLDMLEQARGLNQRLRKTEDIAGVDYKATLQAAKNKASGIDDTLKNNVTGILTNPKRVKGYSPDERAQMENVVTGGGPLSKTNIARQIGRFAPGGGLGFYGGAGAGILGTLAGGNPVAGAALATVPAVAGMIGKKVSERGTRQSMNDLMDLIANGAKAPAAPQMSSQDRDKLGRFLMMMQLQ